VKTKIYNKYYKYNIEKYIINIINVTSVKISIIEIKLNKIKNYQLIKILKEECAFKITVVKFKRLLRKFIFLFNTVSTVCLESKIYLEIFSYLEIP